jgi:hypothetical protein
MIISNYNEMSVEELQAIHDGLGLGFVIEDGEIKAVEQ